MEAVRRLQAQVLVVVQELVRALALVAAWAEQEAVRLHGRAPL